MASLKLVTYPDPILKKRSREVAIVDDTIRTLVDDMFVTMREYQGIGLAAVQVGVLKRVLVIDLQGDSNKDTRFVMINPVIIEVAEEESVYEEGCLSFPGVFAEVKRPETILVDFLDYEGNRQQQHANGLLATCIQHEIDHLNGVTFPDHLSRLKRESLHKKTIKFQKPH